MEGSGLVITTEETGTLAAYRLLTGCVICPNSRKWTDCFLSKPIRRVWKWITEAGLRVPEDISVCGFDDIDIAAYFNPPLTSIKTPCYEMGQMAANIMISAIESQTPLKVQYLLDTELIVRRTCGRVKEK